MKAVVHAGGGEVRVDTVADPELLARTDAVVRVRRAAICGTDLHVVAHPDHLPVGFVLGHEFVGEIVALGDGVRGHQVGDLVAGADYTACGHCWWCRHGDHWECGQRQFFGTGSAFGPPLAGAQAELVRVPYADTVLRAVPDGVGLDTAVFLGDTLATGYAAVQRALSHAGDTVAVVGGGPVGQLVLQVLRAAGAGAVTLVEPSPYRRDIAARLGADVTLTPAELSDRLAAGEFSEVDHVMECSGHVTAVQTALDMVAAGGSIRLVGMATTPPSFDAVRAITKEVRILGGFIYVDEFRQAIDLLAANAVDVDVLTSAVLPLDGYADAFAALREPEQSMKVLLRMGGGA